MCNCENDILKILINDKQTKLSETQLLALSDILQSHGNMNKSQAQIIIESVKLDDNYNSLLFSDKSSVTMDVYNEILSRGILSQSQMYLK